FQVPLAASTTYGWTDGTWMIFIKGLTLSRKTCQRRKTCTGSGDVSLILSLVHSPSRRSLAPSSGVAASDATVLWSSISSLSIILRIDISCETNEAPTLH